MFAVANTIYENKIIEKSVFPMKCIKYVLEINKIIIVGDNFDIKIDGEATVYNDNGGKIKTVKKAKDSES